MAALVEAAGTDWTAAAVAFVVAAVAAVAAAAAAAAAAEGGTGVNQAGLQERVQGRARNHESVRSTMYSEQTKTRRAEDERNENCAWSGK